MHNPGLDSWEVRDPEDLWARDKVASARWSATQDGISTELRSEWAVYLTHHFGAFNGLRSDQMPESQKSFHDLWKITWKENHALKAGYFVQEETQAERKRRKKGEKKNPPPPRDLVFWFAKKKIEGGSGPAH